MFLLHPLAFPWDLAIVLILTFSGAGVVTCLLWIQRHGQRAKHRLFVDCLGCLSLILFATVSYGSFVEPQLIVTTEETIPLPSAEPLTIALLSDLHVGPYKGQAFVARAVKKTNASLPDIILLAGDYIFGPDADLADLAPLQDLRATLGVYAAMGNHDVGRYRTVFSRRDYRAHNRAAEIRALFEDFGITVLDNEHTLVKSGRADIAIAGIDDLWTGEANVIAALDDIPADTPTILISHNPSVIQDTNSHSAHLIVSGHTHGGQVRLPFIGPLVQLPTTLGKQYDTGLFSVDTDTNLALTKGLGESDVRARLWTLPEVMVIRTTPST